MNFRKVPVSDFTQLSLQSLSCQYSRSVVITVAQLYCRCSVVFAVGLWWRFRSDTRVMDPQGMIRNKLCCFRSSEDRKMSEAPCRLPNKWQKDKDKTKTSLKSSCGEFKSWCHPKEKQLQWTPLTGVSVIFSTSEWPTLSHHLPPLSHNLAPHSHHIPYPSQHPAPHWLHYRLSPLHHPAPHCGVGYKTPDEWPCWKRWFEQFRQASCLNPLPANFNYHAIDGSDEVINSNLTRPHERKLYVWLIDWLRLQLFNYCYSLSHTFSNFLWLVKHISFKAITIAL